MSAFPALALSSHLAGAAPSSFACSLSTLVHGQRCIFDGAAAAPAADQSDKNAKAVAAMAEPLCEEASQPPGPRAALVRRQCMERMKQASQKCNGQGQVVVDDQGRFTEAGLSCYRALAEAQTDAHMWAAEVIPCCECLSKNHCASSVDSCVASRPKISSVCSSLCGDACVTPDPPAEVPAP